jgi:hypothetical protein
MFVVAARLLKAAAFSVMVVRRFEVVAVVKARDLVTALSVLTSLTRLPTPS